MLQELNEPIPIPETHRINWDDILDPPLPDMLNPIWEDMPHAINIFQSEHVSEPLVIPRAIFMEPVIDEYRHPEEGLLRLPKRVKPIRKKPSIKYCPTRKFKKEGDCAVECSICLVEFINNRVLRILPCGHEFHTRCIDKWYTNSPSCPLCRVSIT